MENMAWQQQWHRRKFVPNLNFDSCTVKLLQHNHDVEKRKRERGCRDRDEIAEKMYRLCSSLHDA